MKNFFRKIWQFFFLSKEDKKEKEYLKNRELIGHVKVKANHNLYEFDLTEKKVTRVEPVLRNGKKEVDRKENCIYISALNEENAWKKLSKNFMSLLKKD